MFFKPTLTQDEQTFRKTKNGALTYFVVGDPDFPEDKGFALKPWVECGYGKKERGPDEAMILVNIGMDRGQFNLRAKTVIRFLLTRLFYFERQKISKPN
ncbi:hypothetical protein MMU07_18580 [Aquiflexum sp. LQ15W]|nr:hypothetical protein [Cognataquiflexum nitidum]